MTARAIKLLCTALFTAIGFQAAPAFAQSCPPGMFPIGGGSAGWSGCAPTYDPMQGTAVDRDPTPSWARGPSIDPLAGRIEAATTIFEMEAANYTQLQRRLSTDPAFARAYRRYTEGAWEHFQRTEQQQCAAAYSKERNIVLMFEQAGEQTGALLVFVGRKLPTPDAPQRIRAELSQNDDAQPQRVQAYSYRVPGTDYGALALAVPTIDALIGNMLDTHRFVLSVRGQQVFSVEWHGGKVASETLARCVGRHG